MRILVTNDDGIDSIGLHCLARAMREHGDVVVVAPDSEYSGASAAIGALHLIRPDIHKAHIDGIDDAWALAGPPALCVLLASRGAIDGDFDLVVSGINPGANVGRAVYYSGTIGAAVAGRNVGKTGVAVSQAVTFGGVEGQAWEARLEDQLWDSAAEVASIAVGSLVAKPPAEASVLNLNVPNLPTSELKGWKSTEVGLLPSRSMAVVKPEPKVGHQDTYELQMEWGEALADLPVHTDVGAVQAGYVSASWLSPVSAVDGPADATVDAALSSALGDN